MPIGDGEFLDTFTEDKERGTLLTRDQVSVWATSFDNKIFMPMARKVKVEMKFESGICLEDHRKYLKKNIGKPQGPNLGSPGCYYGATSFVKFYII